MNSPFSDDVMTIILGIEPDEPGMHGPLKEPCPSDDAVGLVTKIRDMCDEWLRSAGKAEGSSDVKQPTEVGITDDKESQDEE